MAHDGIAMSPAKKVKHGDSSLPGTNVILPPPTFDLDAWATNYDGGLLPLRFRHIAVHCPALRGQALALALAAAKTGKDTQVYLHLCQLAEQLNLSDLAAIDQEWVNKTEDGNRRELSRKESELRGYKNNLIRESIRMGQEDLAMQLLATGGPPPDANKPQTLSSTGYGAAYQAFAKMRDFCTTPTHISSMMLRLIYTSILQAVSTQQSNSPATTSWNAVIVNAGRLRSVGVKEEEQKKLDPISFATAGLAHLEQSNYRDAAAAFLATPFAYNGLGPVHGTDFGRHVASANDLAIYGGLCALATLSRQDLIDRVLGGAFRQFLELEPHMRKAISLYTTAKYQACLATLQHYYSDWSLDIFLGAPAHGGRGSHVDALFARIREKSITAYFSSFSEVSLASLASTFPPTSQSPVGVEDEIVSLIESGRLDARLDVVNGVLIAPHNDLRSATHANATKAAQEVERTLWLRLHKVNVTMAGLEIPRPKHTAYGGGGGGWEGVSGGNGYVA